FAPVPLGKYYLVETATAPGFVLDSTPIEVVFTPQEQTVRFDIQSKAIENERQKINIDFNKTFEESKWFKREGVTATFGLFAKSDIVGADGTVAIAKDSLLGVTLVTKEEGKGSFTDITVTNQLYIKELATHEAYQLNDANIDVTTDYMPNTDMQRTVEKSVEDPIVNDLKKIKMELLKVAQHDNKTPVAGAKFKLVAVVDDKTTKEIGVYTTDENGRILVDGLEVGNYRFEEIEVPQDYIKPEESVTDVAIGGEQAHGSTQSITVENEKKPRIETTAMVNGAKEVEAAGTITLTDTVTYIDLIPGKEYEAVLVWMDKSTGQPFMVDGKELTVSKKFTPEQSNGEISLSVEVDAKHFTKTVDLVAFEDLLKEGIEVAAHKDLKDEGQTIKVRKPNIKTKAAANEAKEVPASGTITLTDTVTYTDLIPGKEYEAVLVWMDKSTGKPFMVDGKELTVSKKFMAEKADGEVSLSVKLDAKYFTTTTDLVAFEDVSRDGISVVAHKDINDTDQTVRIKSLPKNKIPPTGDSSQIGVLAVVTAACAGTGVGLLIYKRRNRQ
ncbi:MAG: VaFE repeat-containing surface-anchored protein, partial [Eubacteriales bacterium]|nr:VaFE repeat-containing surface-anchored protein [Eubacteriales bacterium]